MLDGLEQTRRLYGLPAVRLWRGRSFYSVYMTLANSSYEISPSPSTSACCNSASMSACTGRTERDRQERERKGWRRVRRAQHAGSSVGARRTRRGATRGTPRGGAMWARRDAQRSKRWVPQNAASTRTRRLGRQVLARGVLRAIMRLRRSFVSRAMGLLNFWLGARSHLRRGPSRPSC